MARGKFTYTPVQQRKINYKTVSAEEDLCIMALHKALENKIAHNKSLLVRFGSFAELWQIRTDNKK